MTRYAGLLIVAFAGVLAACSSGASTSTEVVPGPAAPAADESQVAAAVASGEYDFPTGPAVLVEEGFEPPEDRVASTGAYLPVNGKPTLVMVDAIWCPSCALTRPIFHRIRHEYQGNINLVILDFDLPADAELARSLGAWAHPAWAVVAPDSDEVLERRFGPLNEPNLRSFLDEVREVHAGS